MTLRIYDTMSRSKREFEPRDPGAVSMYVCGPTVYNHIHIGNARTFLSFDVVRRYLIHRGLDVTFVRNITDVDDKIIARASEEGQSPDEVAREYTEAFHDAMRALDVLDPDHEPKATETIGAMIEMVERLLESGHAYEVDGDVYFSVRSFDGYGRLSGRDVDEMRSGARVVVDERKRDPLDFALWKSAKPGEPTWDSPWGPGRPGWHLECSVMSTGRLGESFDIHGGATDLVFPHHENEIAQSEADTGVPFARFWMHGGLLQVDAEKMSKSLGNFLLLKDVLEMRDEHGRERYPAPVVRLLMLQTHYRSPLDFSLARLDEAAAAYERLTNTVRDARGWESGADDVPDEAVAELTESIQAAREKFDAEMDDDFNTAGALGAVFELARATNRFREAYGGGADPQHAEALRLAADTIEELMDVFGVALAGAPETAFPEEVVDLAHQHAAYSGEDPAAAVEALLAARTDARAAKDWATADAIRDGLARAGVDVEDTPQGPRAVVRRA
jgi:cysteinyl-tRNA synthetase